MATRTTRLTELELPPPRPSQPAQRTDAVELELAQRAIARQRERRVVLFIAAGSAVLLTLVGVVIVAANRPSSHSDPAPTPGSSPTTEPAAPSGPLAVSMPAPPTANPTAAPTATKPEPKSSPKATPQPKATPKSAPSTAISEPPMFAVDENAKLHELLAQQNRLLADLNRRLAELETKTESPKTEPAKTDVPPGKSDLASDPKTVAKPAAKLDAKTEPLKIAGHPSAERLMEALGHPLEGVRDIGAAQRAYRELVLAEAAGKPPPADILVPMARTADLLGKPAEALAWAQQALTRLPTERALERAAAARIALAAAFRAGRFELAAETAATVLTETPKSLDAHRLRVRSLLALGRLDDAERAAGQASQPDGAGPLAETERAWVLLARADKAADAGDRESVGQLQTAAHAALDRIASLAETATDREWPLAMGVALLRLGRPSDAVPALRLAAARRPSGPTAQFLLARALLADESAANFAEADAALARAAELSVRAPNDDTELGLPVAVPDWRLGDPRRQVGQCWAVRGQVAARQGKPDEALQRFRQAYMISGDCLSAYLGAAETLLRQERPDLAAEMADEAILVAPGSGAGYVLRAAASAELARRAGQPLDRAAVIRLLRRAVEADPLGTRRLVPRLPGLQPLLADKAVSELLGAGG